MSSLKPPWGPEMEPFWRRLLFLLAILAQVWLAPVCLRLLSSELFASIAVVATFITAQIYLSTEKVVEAPPPGPSFLATPAGQAVVGAVLTAVQQRMRPA